MELWRVKNTDTRIVFPIVDADGDPTSHADDNTPDSEWLSWDSADHGGAAPSFADCTHEYVEIANGIYYLDVSAAEINKEFTLIQCKTTLAGCKTQVILIRTFVSTDALMAAIADAVTDEVASGHSGAGSVGKLISDNLNAPIGTVDTVVDAIKAKTDMLPAVWYAP